MKSYDQKLRDAMSEIEEVLRKYDCGALISLHSKSHSEFRLFIETPTWSNVRWIRDGQGVHLKLHSKSDHENTEATVAMLADIKDQCAMWFLNTEKLMEQIKSHVTVVHVPFGGGIKNEDRI